MNCPSCQHENNDNAKFCESCGTKLGRACANCGESLSSEARFCPRCGTAVVASANSERPVSRTAADYTPKHLADKILNSRSALEGERKQVTVLFADVKQSTELAAAVDVEDWHQILDRFFTLLSEGVHRYEGTINQYTGDGVMALFGAPVAHEDHAQRACWAALSLLEDIRNFAQEIRRRHGLNFQIRIGINSGEVVVGKIGDDLRMDYTAQGAVVHLASRTQDLAEAGTAYLAPVTAERVGPYFQLESLGEFQVKGVDAPQSLYRLIGAGEASSNFDVARSRGLTSFVGRNNEMQILEAALEQARAGNGQVVGIGAEAGTGKSRLCFEFLQDLRDRGLKVLYGTCVAHGKNLAFHPILQVLRNYYGIIDQDSAGEARQKVDARMAALGHSFREDLPLIHEFLGISDPNEPPSTLPPEARQRRLFALLRENLRHGPEPGQRVGIVVIEDLHWIDEGSDEWISHWVDSTAGAHSLLVVNFRPEYHPTWSHRTHYQQISLAPLSLETTRELLTSLLGHDASIPSLIDRVHLETGGNPFYAEEVVQSLIESAQLIGHPANYVLQREVARLNIPASIQAVLAARIDRLNERGKRVLQVASVIGKDFEESVLGEAVELSETELREAINLLREAEFVNEQQLYPVTVYSFKHPLTQQVANESLLRETRWELHKKVAEALERRSSDLGRDAALLAHHYDAANEPITGARWHSRAAEWINVNDVSAAATHARAVINALENREDTEGAYTLLAAAAWKLLGLCIRIGVLPDADDIFLRGTKWAEHAGDPSVEAAICGLYSGILAVDGRMTESMEVNDRYKALAVEVGDPELILISNAWAYQIIRMGRFDEAEAGVRKAISVGERNPEFGRKFYGVGMTGLFLFWLADIQAHRGHSRDASNDFEQALAWVIRHQETEAHIYLMYTLSARIRVFGGAHERLPMLRDGAAMAEEFGAVWPLTIARVALAEVLLAVGGAADEVLETMEIALSDARDRRMARMFEGEILVAMAQAELELGNPDTAIDLAREAVEKASSIPLSLVLVLDSFSKITLALGRFDECANALERMEQLVRDIGAHNYLPLVIWRRSELALAQGEMAERTRLLVEAKAGFIERGATEHAKTIAELQLIASNENS